MSRPGLNTTTNRVFCLLLSYRGYLQFYLNNYTTRSELERAIYKIDYEDGNTNTSGGLYVMNKEVTLTIGNTQPLLGTIYSCIVNLRHQTVVHVNNIAAPSG